ncbi:MAG TPA: hypothetical protein PLB89_17570 [Flavobacteriales bacterium]|nr:hypothetical protein [Flavobacteriales bacterium]
MRQAASGSDAPYSRNVHPIALRLRKSIIPGVSGAVGKDRATFRSPFHPEQERCVLDTISYMQDHQAAQAWILNSRTNWRPTRILIPWNVNRSFIQALCATAIKMGGLRT